MTWDPRPTPDITPETEPYWSAAAEGRLLVRECPNCSLVYHYPRALCPDCFAEAEWREAGGTGKVYSYTVLNQMSGWPEDALPVIFAYVELNEGPRMITNIVNCEPEDVKIGTHVEVRFEDTEDENVAIPTFTPAEGYNASH